MEHAKAKIEKARADAEAAIAEDANHAVPAGVLKGLELKTKELDCMDTDIDLVAKGDHMNKDTAGATKATQELLKRHRAALKSFANVLRSIAKATEHASE